MLMFMCIRASILSKTICTTNFAGVNFFAVIWLLHGKFVFELQAHALDREMLQRREVVKIDIANDPVDRRVSWHICPLC